MRAASLQPMSFMRTENAFGVASERTWSRRPEPFAPRDRDLLRNFALLRQLLPQTF